MKSDQYKAARLIRKLNQYKEKLDRAVTAKEIGECLKMIKLYEDVILTLDV